MPPAWLDRRPADTSDYFPTVPVLSDAHKSACDFCDKVAMTFSRWRLEKCAKQKSQAKWILAVAVWIDAVLSGRLIPEGEEDVSDRTNNGNPPNAAQWRLWWSNSLSQACFLCLPHLWLSWELTFKGQIPNRPVGTFYFPDRREMEEGWPAIGFRSVFVTKVTGRGPQWTCFT